MPRSVLPTLSIRAVLASIAMAVALLPTVGSGVAGADPVIASGALLSTVTSPNGSYVERVVVHDPRHLSIFVHSASMNHTYELQVQRPANTDVPRPTLYLLNGAGGGVDAAQWRLNTDVLEWSADQNLNIVSPVGGPFTYYADWRAPDPNLGVNKWQTFLTEEIPPIVDAGLGTNGLNSVAGLSTSGTTVLALAESHPGLYESVAAYSGCAQMADPVGYNFVKLTVNVWGGGNVDNMYGPEGDPMWAANDPVINAEKLRGTDLYISSGSGLPGPHENPDDRHTMNGAAGLPNQILIGGAIEAATNYCTHNLANRLNELGIPATYNFRPTGTHSWGYWEDDFKSSWPVIAGSLGI